MVPKEFRNTNELNVLNRTQSVKTSPDLCLWSYILGRFLCKVTDIELANLLYNKLYHWMIIWLLGKMIDISNMQLLCDYTSYTNLEEVCKLR